MSAPPRVVIRVRGGGEIGMGHVSRSLTLARTFSGRGVEVAGFMCDRGDDIVAELVRSSGYEVWGRAADEAAGAGGILLFDVPGPEPGLVEWAREHGFEFLAALDYRDFDEDRLDLIINLFNHHPFLKRPRAGGVAYREGPRYAIIRSEFDPFIAAERDIRADVRDVLIMVGGCDFRGYTARLLEAWKAAGDLGATVQVVAGPGFRDADDVRRLCRDLGRGCRLHSGEAGIERLMFDCDLAFCNGGTTMLELAALGTPALVLPQNEDEERFGRYFAKLGAVVCLDRDFDARAAWSAARALAEDREARLRMSRAGREAVDGRGRERIVLEIMELWSGRTAAEK